VGHLLLRKGLSVLCLEAVKGGGMLVGDGSLSGDVLLGEERSSR
jgi:hypothetical protein